jgi:hypothetical protein
MNSIADVLALAPGPSWHECVAIIQEIAANLEPAQPVPAPEDLLLEADGTVTFGFAGESARPQVADLASLLDTFLKKTEAPQGLRDLATENARDEPAHSTMASFTRALAFYERPNRRSDLQALAGRLDGRGHAVQADRAFAEIRERLVQKSEEAKAPDAVSKPAAPKKTDRERAVARARPLAIAAAVVLGAAAVSAMTVLRGWSSAAKPGTTVAAEAAIATGTAGADESSDRTTDVNGAKSRPVSRERAVSTEPAGSRAHHPVGTSASTHEGKPAKSSHPSGPSRAARAGREDARAFKAAATNGIAAVRPLPSPDRAASVAPSTGSPGGVVHVSRADDVSSAEDATYSSGDPGVTPPVWYRRQLPSEPSPDAKTGYYDIVIDTNGDVESVRLISPTRRYEERMLMAAAKAWKFRPARLNGQPVKYRMRVPITLTWTIDQ